MLEGSILDQLRSAHKSGRAERRSLNFGVYYKNTLVALCHALEDCILTCSSEPLVITAFQRGKWYLEEADRYSELADRSRQIVIMASPDAGFAEHPTSQKPVVELVHLQPDDPVAQEWHLVILAPTYSAMVLCQELSVEDYGQQGVPTQDLERKFYGFWTFETQLVQETIELAIAHIQGYDAPLADKLTAQLDAILAMQTGERDDMMPVVSRVIDYLQTSQDTLSAPLVANSFQDQVNSLDNNLLSNEVQAFLRLAQLTDQADMLNPAAAAETAALAETLGQLLDLPVWQLNRLKLAGLLHRLSPFQQSQSVLSGETAPRYTEGAAEIAPSCPLIPGAQVLRKMPRLRAIATIITHQTECWDGSGLPGNLAGDAIPLESRILGLAAEFQHHLAICKYEAAQQPDSATTVEDCLSHAIAHCQQDQNTRWDPKLVETLSLLVSGLQQGLGLAVSAPKISAGLWLLDSHYADDLFRDPRDL